MLRYSSLYFYLTFGSCFLQIYSNETKISAIELRKFLNDGMLADKLSETVFQIGKKIFSTNDIIYVVLPKYEDENLYLLQIMNKIHKKFSSLWTTFTTSSYCGEVQEWSVEHQKNIILQYKPDVYVIPIFNSIRQCNKCFNFQLEKLEKQDTFNPRAIFILIVCEQKYQDKDYVTTLFDQMWAKNIFNAILMIKSTSSQEFLIAMAKPFSQENTCRSVKENGIKYIQVPQKVVGVELNMTNILIKNFNGCIFSAGTIPIPPYVVGRPKRINNETVLEVVGGIDIELIKLASEKMNFTFRFYKTTSYQMEAWSYTLKNGSKQGILPETIEHKNDIAFGGLIPSYESVYNYEYSISYKYSSLEIYVINANALPQWTVYLKVFSASVWFLYGLVFVVICLLYHCIEISQFSDYNIWSVPASKLFAIGLGCTSNLKPKRCSLRILYTFWAIYSLHLCISYSAGLFTLYTKPPHGKEILTFKDLNDSGYNISIHNLYLGLLDHSDLDEETRSVLEKSVICNEFEDCVKSFVKYRNFSVMAKVEQMEYLINLKETKVHKLSQCVLTFGVSFITNKGNPLYRELNTVIGRVFQSGLMLKWERDIGSSYKTKSNKGFEHVGESKRLVLKLQDLKPAFLIMGIGLLVSFVSFIVEIFLHAISSNGD